MAWTYASATRLFETGSYTSRFPSPARVSAGAGVLGVAGRDGKVVRPANGMLTRVGRPPLGAAAKQQATLRLDADVLAKFRECGPGWQGRINAALRVAAGLA